MASGPFVGRRAELMQLQNLLERLASGRGGAVVVVGEPGIGKTRLLDEIARLAPDDLLTARTECLPLSTPLPFEAVLELLRKARRRAPELSVPRAATAGAGLFTAVVEEIERLASARPALLAVDDLQFSDAATRELVHYCVARLADLPVGWVLATRPDPDVETFVHYLVRAGLATELRLRGLDIDELRELIAACLGTEAVDLELASALHARSQGNVFFAEELLRVLHEEGRLVDASRAAPAEPLERRVPPSVAQAVRARAKRLPGSAREVLVWASVLPTPIEPGVLARVAGPSAEREASTLVDATLLVEEPEGWRFVHEMIRDAVYGGLSHAERARRHSAVADALDPDDLARRAPQLAAAGRGEEAAAAYVGLGDAALARGAPADAEDLFDRAAELALEAGKRTLRRRAEAGTVLALLRRGKVEAARALADSVLRELRGARSGRERLQFLSRYATALWNDVGDLDAARAVIDEAEPLLESASGRELAEAAAARAHILDRGGDPAAALPLAERALRAARAAKDRALEARALNCLGLAVGQVRDAREGMAIAQEAADLAAAEGLPEEEALAYLRLSYLSEICGDQDGHESYARRGTSVRNLSPTFAALLRGNIAVARMKKGELDSAFAHLLAARRAAQRAGGRNEERVALQVALVQIARGELDDAASVLGNLKPSPGSSDHARQLLYLGHLSEERGEHSAALRYYLVAGRGEFPSTIFCLAGAVRTASVAGDLDTARASLERMEKLASRWPVGSSLVPSARAALAEAEGRLDEAVALFDEASAACDDSRERTRLVFEAARLRGDRDGIVEAIEAFESMGARLAADRARAVARSLGMRPGRRRRAERGVLTPREQEIANLVAAGKTNAEIASSIWISPRTVERHVGTILEKLGHRSRVELAAAVAAGDLPGRGVQVSAEARGAG